MLLNCSLELMMMGVCDILGLSGLAALDGIVRGYRAEVAGCEALLIISVRSQYQSLVIQELVDNL